MKRYLHTLLATIVLCGTSTRAADYDVVIYGLTSAGVTAAVQTKKMGKTVILIGPEKHLGGLSSSGLGSTDTGNKAVIGGLAREFYHRVWLHYDRPDAWNWQKQSEYGNKGQGTPAIDGDMRTMWIFEPHVAEAVFEDLVREQQVPVDRDQWLDRDSGVKKQRGRIVSIRMLGGRIYSGRMFIDATYEGGPSPRPGRGVSRPGSRRPRGLLLLGNSRAAAGPHGPGRPRHPALGGCGVRTPRCCFRHRRDGGPALPGDGAGPGRVRQG